jgi:Family of unknown function (DUF5694)
MNVRWLCLGLASLLPLSTMADPPKPATVIIVGTFHMANPGRDMHNVVADDMLSEARQKQIAAVGAGLERFKPTVVAVEWSPGSTAEPYAKYRAGTLKPSRNEVVQLGFRLANAARLDVVHGIDVEGDFPYEPVDIYAKAHGQSAMLVAANQDIEAYVQRLDDLLKEGTVTDALRFLNDPKRLISDNGFYRSMLRVGGGAEQPGVGLLTAWYHRNFLICANLIQLAKPGDRVVVFYGAGHSFLLRQCVAETPGFVLAEAIDYLPPQ